MRTIGDTICLVLLEKASQIAVSNTSTIWVAKKRAPNIRYKYQLAKLAHLVSLTKVEPRKKVTTMI